MAVIFFPDRKHKSASSTSEGGFDGDELMVVGARWVAMVDSGRL
ncbi:hypothetical protein Patl1_14998 [Pistacia atlantica]|uniref:Uncharacterized protein n=1 Tax=Pistacia atlantica TaxID=434234 RepID=A0ACC1B650_9ROSI|nr:hypothetical protein Patl1_14998 [Pistacia atlantica]